MGASAVLFDLDGTLVHSAPDIHAAANAMLAEAGAAAVDLPTVQGFIGEGAAVLVARLMAARGLPPGRHEELLARFRAAYDTAPARLTRPWPGVPGALAALARAGHALGVVTNKPEAPARAVLAALGLAEHIAVVVGGDSLPVRKPDPGPLIHALAALGAADGIFVGDSEIDAAAAAAAGLPFALFTRGYRRAPAEAIAAALHFDDFAGLPAALAALRAGA